MAQSQRFKKKTTPHGAGGAGKPLQVTVTNKGIRVGGGRQKSRFSGNTDLGKAVESALAETLTPRRVKPSLMRRTLNPDHADTTAKPAVSGDSSTTAVAVANKRDRMIRQRNRYRRYPWIAAAVALGVGVVAYLVSRGVGHGIGWAFSVSPDTVRGVFAVAPLVFAVIPPAAGGVVAFRHRVPARWLPEFAAAGVGGGVVTYAVGVWWLSWWLLLLVVVGTVVLGRRWWREHPIGPKVPPLEVPADKDGGKTREPATDVYAKAWAEHNAKNSGKAPGSLLTDRDETEHTVDYTVQLKPGAQTLRELLAARADLAGGIGVPTERVVFRAAPRGSSASLARLSVITGDPVGGVRYFEYPRVERGIIRGVARSSDGAGDVDLTMWNRQGTVPTMVVGSTGGGKSGAANLITVNALSTGLLNLIYIDPKGNSSTALASRARVAILGLENALQVPALLAPILAGRGALGRDLLFPSKEIPGLMVLHDEFSFVSHTLALTSAWAGAANTVRALAMWLVALNQSQGVSEWGTEHARQAFAGQVVAFRTNSKSSGNLVPGLMFDPVDLPVDEQGNPVPGWASHSYRAAPAVWDFLPSDADADRMAEDGETLPPFTTSSAFDRYFLQPPLHEVDEEAITSVLGPPVNGRWQVGGVGATHTFPPPDGAGDDEFGAGYMEPRREQARWGEADLDDPEAGLTPNQREVLGLVRGGVVRTADILDAAAASKSTVMGALSTLETRGLVANDRHGFYQAP